VIPDKDERAAFKALAQEWVLHLTCDAAELVGACFRINDPITRAAWGTSSAVYGGSGGTFIWSFEPLYDYEQLARPDDLPPTTFPPEHPVHTRPVATLTPLAARLRGLRLEALDTLRVHHYPKRKDTARLLVWTVPARALIVAHTEELVSLLDKIVAVLKKRDRGGSALKHLAKKRRAALRLIELAQIGGPP
jgi:hypothetical protein